MKRQSSSISRRKFIKGAAAGSAAIGGSTILSGCGFGWAKGAAGGLVVPPPSEKVVDQELLLPVSFTARTNDDSGLAIARALADAYEAETGIIVSMQGSGDTNVFQDEISEYLQENPSDAFQWMAGFRTNFRADQGLLVDLSANIKNLANELPEGFVMGATNPTDGKQYIIPMTWYPWGLHYRKSILKSVGLDPEGLSNWDDLMKLLDGCKRKGLVGYALGDQGGWEAMGTFSSLNVRLNGYKYHIDLLNGRAKWTDEKTIDVFKQFALLIPYMNKDVLNISWDGMKNMLLNKKCGAVMMGSWWANDFKERSQKDYEDLWIVSFPEINPDFGRDAIDAPVDGICVAANSSNPEGGAAFAEWCGSEAGMLAAQSAGDTSLYANSRLDTSGYDSFNKQKVAIVREAKSVMNYLDRDCRADFAFTVGVQIQNFLKNPSDINKIVDELQNAWTELDPVN
jgi:multiple sugar transport system substrate-binding protein